MEPKNIIPRLTPLEGFPQHEFCQKKSMFLLLQNFNSSISPAFPSFPCSLVFPPFRKGTWPWGLGWTIKASADPFPTQRGCRITNLETSKARSLAFSPRRAKSNPVHFFYNFQSRSPWPTLCVPNFPDLFPPPSHLLLPSPRHRFMANGLFLWMTFSSVSEKERPIRQIQWDKFREFVSFCHSQGCAVEHRLETDWTSFNCWGANRCCGMTGFRRSSA